MPGSPQLDDWVVRDVNREPRLPCPDASFDAVACAVSVQYLVQPLDVFADTLRVLVPGGPLVGSFSNRCFPTKAVAIWLSAGDDDHRTLLRTYLGQAGFVDAGDERVATPADLL